MYKRISQEKLKEFLSYSKESGLFTWIKRGKNIPTGSVAGCKKRDGYVHIGIDGITYSAHRLAWIHEFGEIDSMLIDHINGNRDDNRIENLRLVNHLENSQNCIKKKSNSSGFKGVSLRRGSNLWRAYIHFDGRHISLGNFKSAESAYEARRNAELKLFSHSPLNSVVK